MAVFFAAASAVAAPSWTPPAQVAPAPDFTPEIAVNAAGDAVVAWQGNFNPSVYGVFASVRDVGSSAWSAPVPLRDYATFPTAYLDARGNAIVEYQVTGALGSEQYGAFTQIRERRQGSSTWTDPVTLGVDAIGTSIALDPLGDVFALWGSGITEPVVQFSQRSPGGSWLSPRDIAPGDYPVVATDSRGDALAAWWQDRSRVVASFLPAGSGAWQTPTVLGDNVEHPGAIRIGFDAAGNALVVWDADDGLHVAARAASGMWRGDTRLENEQVAFGDRFRLVVSPSGQALVVWWSTCSGCALDGVTLDTDGNVSPPFQFGAGGSFDLALDPRGNAIAVWTDETSTWSALHPAHSGVWVPTGKLGAGSPFAPSVAVDGTGRAIAVWSTDSGLESSELVANGPLLANVVIPNVGRPGTRVPFKATAFPWSAALAGGAPRWDFGDGTPATARSVHVYRRSGPYNVSVSAHDVAGGTTTQTGQITITKAAVANVRPPSIRGIARVGRTLTCRRGSWVGAPRIQFTYFWLSDGKLIADAFGNPTAEGAHYRVKSVDRGHRLACRVNAFNSTNAMTATSRPVLVRR
jgi:hypothetical protein